jgi:poly(3-hydroxybutyrate) depolymerase
MIYHAYDAYEQILAPLRWLAQEAAYHFAQPWPGMREGGWPASWPATLSVMAQARLTHARPEFGIDRVMIGSREVAIREEIALRRPFCTLLHFAKDIAASQPRVLIVAPLLGHLVLALPAKRYCLPCNPRAFNETRVAALRSPAWYIPLPADDMGGVP